MATATVLIAIALNPISIVIGYYLGQSLQAPRLKIEYVAADAETAPLNVDKDTIVLIRTNMVLRTHIDNSLPDSCKNWLRDGSISKDCVSDAIQAVEKLVDQFSFERDIIDYNLSRLNEWDGVSELSSKPIVLPHLTKSINLMARENKDLTAEILKNYLSALQDNGTQIRNLHEILKEYSISTEAKRTGEVALRVGVLNSGDSDGIVFPDAVLEFGDTLIALNRGKDKKYTVIKGHSFKELILVVNEGESKSDSPRKMAFSRRETSTGELCCRASGFI